VREPSMSERLTRRPSKELSSIRRCLVILHLRVLSTLSVGRRCPSIHGSSEPFVKARTGEPSGLDAGAEAAGDLGRHRRVTEVEPLDEVAAVGGEAGREVHGHARVYAFLVP